MVFLYCLFAFPSCFWIQINNFCPADFTQCFILDKFTKFWHPDRPSAPHTLLKAMTLPKPTALFWSLQTWVITLFFLHLITLDVAFFSWSQWFLFGTSHSFLQAWLDPWKTHSSAGVLRLALTSCNRRHSPGLLDVFVCGCEYTCAPNSMSQK